MIHHLYFAVNMVFHALFIFFFEGTAPNGQSVKLLYTIQFENINIISTHITSPSWYEVDVAVRVVAPLDCSSSVSSDGGEGCAED